MQLQYVEWSPDSKQILFVTPQGEVHIYDALGNFVGRVPLFSDDATAKIAGIMWYNMVEGLVDPQVTRLFHIPRGENILVHSRRHDHSHIRRQATRSSRTLQARGAFVPYSCGLLLVSCRESGETNNHHGCAG